LFATNLDEAKCADVAKVGAEDLDDRQAAQGVRAMGKPPSFVSAAEA
jgi:hypothetical protein